MKAIAIAAVFVASYVGCYWYADSLCIPAQQTTGFCPLWVWHGTLVIPTLAWLCVLSSIATFKREKRK